jgi:uncharacterized protein YjbI with pentapeptide repeats
MNCEFQLANGRTCQFRSEDHYQAWNGKIYCIWHLPHERKQNWSETERNEFAELLADRIRASAKEGGVLDLVGVVSTIPVSLEGLTFSRVDLQHAKVLSDFNCQKLTVTESIDCRNLQVNSQASFDNATFAAAVFSDAAFQGPVSFHEVNIEGAAEFDGAVFQAHAVFSGTTFGGRASFQHSTFKAETSFLLARFFDRALFGRVTFESGVVFDDARFDGFASFEPALFRGHAEFRSVIFRDHAVFRATTFESYVAFRNATFEKDAMFSVLVPATSRLPFSTWEGAKFRATASFENREFSTQGNFENVEFARAPIFHGCAFHEAMVFPQESAFKERSGAAAAQAYRTLRLAMEKLSAKIEAGQFYALEHEARRNTPGQMSATERSLSYLYDKVSNYGRNGARPIAWLFALAAFFGVAYAAITTPVYFGEPDWPRIGRALSFSLEQVVQPVGIWRDTKSDLFGEAIPLWVRWVCTLQSLLAIALVSLSLLAIRWRFKRE